MKARSSFACWIFVCCLKKMVYAENLYLVLQCTSIKKKRLSLNTLWVFECNVLWQNQHINGTNSSQWISHTNSKEQQQTSAAYGIYQPVCMWTQPQRPQLPMVSTNRCAREHSHRDLSCLWYLPTGVHVNTATKTSATYGIYQPVCTWTQPQRPQLPMVSTRWCVSEQKVDILDRLHQSHISFKLKVKTYVKDRCTRCENLLLWQCWVWSPLESSAPPLPPQCGCNWNHGNSTIITIIIISLSLTFVVVVSFVKSK